MRLFFKSYITIPLVASALAVSASSTLSAAEIPVGRSETAAAANRAKGTPEATLYQGRLAYLDYDFPAAQKHYNTYSAAKKKTPEGVELLEIFRRQLEIAEESLDNVRKLTLISKKNIPADDFLKVINLPRSAGQILSGESIPEGLASEIPQGIYASEKGDYMIWGEGDNLYESERLTDGTWQQPESLKGLGEGVALPDYPFLRSDGASIYFASEGPDSMGGYDLFVAGRDTDTGEFLAPRNLGMPFNSPFDDYMVAIDEENGLAWLVSDREQREGEVTVYLYMFEENRSNYEPDAENLIAHARLTYAEDFIGEDSPEAEKRLRALSASYRPEKSRMEDDFEFYLPGGKVLRRVGDFHSPAARVLAGKYHDAIIARRDAEETLNRLRSEFHDARSKKDPKKMDQLRARILPLEKSVAEMDREILQLRSQISDMEQ